jgi:hypothetical protein
MKPSATNLFCTVTALNLCGRYFSKFIQISFSLAVIVGLACDACAQGTVVFANSSATRLTTNDLQGSVGYTTGVNAYRIGLYIAPQGTTDPNVFSLMPPTAVNRTDSGDGLFNGNPPGGFFGISNNIGQPIAFQVRAWSYFAGATYEEALVYGGPETVYRGSSAIGQADPATGSGSPPLLFGTLPGQVGGFMLTPIIPEPSTMALAVVGAGVLWFATRRRRK